MNAPKKVSFDTQTKPPNFGPMKIHTPRKIYLDSIGIAHIKLIMLHTNVTRDVAVKVYMECEKDLCNSLLYIKNCKSSKENASKTI